MCHYGNQACSGPDREHECRTSPAPIAASYRPPTLAELEQALAAAEETLRRECAAYMAARAAVQTAQDGALDVAVRWGRAMREAATARKAVTREHEALEMIARVVGRRGPAKAITEERA